MEDIVQKLGSGNVFLQSQAISSLNELILKKVDGADPVFECVEVKKLWESANEGGMGLSTLAVESLVSLVRQGTLPAPAVIQNFLADVSSAKSPISIVRGITCLFLLLCEIESDLRNKNEDSVMSVLNCPFTSSGPRGPNHPYILLIKRKPEMANAIVEEIKFIFNHPDQRVQRSWLNLVKPLIHYSICLTETTIPLTEPLLNLLISSHGSLGRQLVEFLCKVATYARVNNRCHFERKVSVLCGLASIALETKNNHLMAALLPGLVMCLPHSIKYELPTRTLECFVLSLAAQLGQGCDITICALAEALPFTSGTLQLQLIRVGATLLTHKDGNPLVSSCLLPSLLQILSGPTSAVPGLGLAASTLVSLIQAIPMQLSTNTQLSGNTYWELLRLCFPVLSTFVPAVDLCNQIVKDPQTATDWLTKLASTVHQISKFHYSIVTAVFVYQGSISTSVQESVKVLEREVGKCKSLSLELFPLVLYRLGREKDPPTTLALLYMLPSLAVNKLTVAMVLKTLLALWVSSPLRPIILRLLLEVWRVEPRIYSHLSQLLNDKSDITPELEIARAYVVSQICKDRPHQHGEELLSLLSSFLNECRGQDGTGQTMIALDGIYELCFETVIDLRTTWRVIAPKLIKDKRPEVIAKLCKLVSLSPKLEVKSVEYEEFNASVATILWSWATSKIKNSVNEAAFTALKAFPVSNFRLKMLPVYAREGHKLPEKMASTPFEAAKKAEDVLDYVPGLAWVKLLIGSPKAHSDYVQLFVNEIVKTELMALPKGIYITAIQEAKKRGVKGIGGQPEPSSYSFLPETSILKSFVNYLQDFSKLLAEATDEEHVNRLLHCAAIVLISLGQPLNRPFPALNWSFLNEVLNGAEKWISKAKDGNWIKIIRQGIFRVAAQQCNKSSSALNLISKYMSNPSTLSKEDQIHLFNLLDQLGRGLSPQLLQPFLHQTLTNAVDESISDKSHLKNLIDALQPHLTCDYIHDANRNVLSNAVESLNDNMNPSDNYLFTSFKACVADLPAKHIERLTSPSLWWEVTPELLLRASILRCHVASNDPSSSALPWLNDLVDCATTLPGDLSPLLELMSETLIIRSSAEESQLWLLTLLGRLRDLSKRHQGDNLVLIHQHNQRVTFLLDLLVMGLLVWSGLWATSPLQKIASSPKIRNNLLTPALVSLNGRMDWEKMMPQIFNWLLVCVDDLEPMFGSRYGLRPCLQVVAAMTDDLSQATWNKMVEIAS